MELPPPPRMSYWLTFPRQQEETAFRRRQVPAWVARDKVLFLMAPVMATMELIEFKSPSMLITAVHHVWIIVSFLLLPLTFVAMMWRGNVYIAKRINIITAFRIYGAISSGLVFFVYDPAKIWVPGLISARLVLRPPTLSMVFTTMKCLPFRRHAWVQFFCVLLSSVWVASLCSACNANPEVESEVNRIGWYVERQITNLSVLGLLADKPPLKTGQHSCWMVGLFSHFWVGYLAPSFGLYVMELLARMKFLRNSLGSQAGEELKLLRTGMLVLGGVVLLVGTQTLWVVLKAVMAAQTYCLWCVDHD